MDFAAEVLDTVDLSRSQCCDGCFDRVGSDVCLGPVSTLHEMYGAAEICSWWIYRCLDNDPRWICEDNDGTRFSEEESRLL